MQDYRNVSSRLAAAFGAVAISAFLFVASFAPPGASLAGAVA